MPRTGICIHGNAATVAGAAPTCPACIRREAERRPLVIEDPLLADIRRIDVDARKLRGARPTGR